jgi:hypothetical protein
MTLRNRKCGDLHKKKRLNSYFSPRSAQSNMVVCSRDRETYTFPVGIPKEEETGSRWDHIIKTQVKREKFDRIYAAPDLVSGSLVGRCEQGNEP